MGKEQVQMFVSWVILGTMFFYSAMPSNHGESFSIMVPGILASIIYIIRSGIPDIEHLHFHEMSKPLQYYALIHYCSFAIFGLFIAFNKPELMNHEPTSTIILIIAMFLPLLPSVIKTEAKLFKSYGNKNA